MNGHSYRRFFVSGSRQFTECPRCLPPGIGEMLMRIISSAAALMMLRFIFVLSRGKALCGPGHCRS
jgi:hypothetical protein